MKHMYVLFFFVVCLFPAFLLKGFVFKCDHRQTTLSAKRDTIYTHFIS